MKSLRFSLILITLLAIPFLAFSQTFLWEEDFDPPNDGWVLQDNWSFTSGYMQFYFSPTIDNYNLSATSPVIALPDNAGDLIISQYINFYSFVNEAFEIAVLADDEVNVLWTHTAGTNWGIEGGQDLTLSLIPFQNQSVQLRFRSFGASTWNINWWRIYNIGIEGSFDDDLEALSISGPVTPSVGTAANYSVTVRNNGVNTQTDYTVRLMQEGEVEIASLPGTIIETGETIDFTFSWTPLTEGPTYLYGEVDLDDDEVPENNTTAPLNVVVMPDDILVATLGTGTETNTTTGAAPVNIYFRSIRTQTVYTAAELNQQGMFGVNEFISLAYYVTSPPIYDMPNFRIRMRHTTAVDASEHIEGPYELVYQNPSYMPDSGTWSLIPLSNPFEWNGVDNILVDTTFDMVNPTWNSSGQQYIYTATDGMRFVRSDGANQGDAITTSIVQYKPQLQIQYTPGEIFDNDMGAFAISGPPNLSPGSEGTFSITVRNMGINSQNNYTIRLMREGDIELASVTGTTNLEQYEMTTYDIPWTPTPQDEGILTLWGEVALTGDQNPDNDATHTIQLVVADAFSGTYTINHDGTGDFESFSQAVNSMFLVGVDGPTLFEVAEGSYTEQVVVPEIMGASAVNTITFRGIGDTIDDVILAFTPTDTSNRHIVKLDGAKHVRFDNLTIAVNDGASHGWVFHITNASEDIEITNCYLSTIATATSTFYGGIIVSGSPTGATTLGNNVNTILIENNTIFGGYYGITLIGAAATLLENATVTENTILDSYYYGMYINQTTEPLISQNTIDMRSEGTVANFGSGIHSLNSVGPFEFSRNRIINPGQYGIYIASSNSPTVPSLIANNMIGGGFRNTGTLASGIYLTTSSNIGVYYNSINNDSVTGRGIYSLASATQLDIRNNSFVFSGTGNGHAAYHASAVSISAHDYNNYYSGTSPNFVFYGAAVNNLAALQAINTPPGNDQNSLDVDPLYVDTFDLDIQAASELIGAGTPVAEVLLDFHGNPRHPDFPTIGAHEFDISGFGSLDGYVYNQANNEPLSGAFVQVEDTNYTATTNIDGYFIMPFVFQGSYNVTASLFGFHDQTLENVLIEEDETTTVNFHLNQLANVTVSGQVVGSDLPAVGIEDAVVTLTGYSNYNTLTGPNGMFSIPEVYSNHTYTLTILTEGYSPYTADIPVGATDLDLGVIIVDEIAYPPHTLIATQSPDESQVDLIWNSPLAIDHYFYDFEDGDQGWTSGAIGGSLDHWELGTPAQTNINGAHSGVNAWMTRLTINYDNNANTWLMSPELNLSAYNDVHFSVFLNIWSEAGWDATILEASTDGGNSWMHVRSDDTALAFYNNSSTSGPMSPPKWSGRTAGVHGIWTEFYTEIPELANEPSVFFRFRFGSDGSVVDEGIAVDDVYIGSQPPDRSRQLTRLSSSYSQPKAAVNRAYRNNPRVLENYNVYRFLESDLENEDNWTILAAVTDTTYTDLTWAVVPNGYYYYAVKAVYTNDVLSDPAISDMLEKGVYVTVSGQVVGSDYPDIGLEGASVSLTGEYDYHVETGANGMFTIPLVYMLRTYTLTINAEGYAVYTDEIDVPDEDLDLGVLIVDEIAFPPRNVVATQSADDTSVDLIWNSPVPVVDFFYDFEDGAQGWTTGGIGGSADHWELGTPAQTNINSAYSGVNAWMTRLTQNYDNNANTWLMSPELDLTNMQDVYFSVWLNIWCENNWDGMILEASTDGGNSWIHVRSDDTAPFEFYNNSSTSGPIAPPKWSGRTIGVHGIWTEFSTYIPELAGENSVFFRFRFGSDGSVVDEGIAVDDVYIGPEPPSRRRDNYLSSAIGFPDVLEEYRHSRILEGYIIYRFLYDDLHNEDNWVELATVTDSTYTDLTWATVPSGFYRYGVKGEYTNDVLSPPAISNWVGKDMTTNVTVNITTDVGDSAEGALVQLFYQDQDPDGNSPIFTGTAVGSNPSVATLLNVLRGLYNIEVTLPGYSTYTQTSVNIQTPLEIDVVLDEIPYPPTNLVYTAGNNLVSLSWDAPDPSASRYSSHLPDYSEVFRKVQEMGITDKEEVEREIRAIMESSVNLQSEKSSRINRTRMNNRSNRALLGYNVYRDGIQINTDPIEVTTYNDTTVDNNVTYIYYVTAVYTMSESEPSNSVTVVPGPNQLIIIGEDTTAANTLPFNFFWRNSLSQTIYMADELNIAGVITQIQYFNTFSTNLPNMPVKIYMGTTTQTDLTAGWIPSTQLEMVFDGNVDFPAGQNTIAIDLDEFFFYDGTQNLVVFAHRPMDTQYYSSLDQFYYSTTIHDNRSRNINSDSVTYDPANPPDGGTLTNRVPNTGIYIVTVGMGSLDGYVYDENNQPMEGAMITVADTDFVQYSNVQGYYLFPFMFEGTHTVTASKFGYYDGVAENVIVEEYETTTVNFTLNPLPTVTVSGRVVGSDQPDVGLDNAFIILDGYYYYETNGDDNGLFSIPGVYADHTYTMTVQRGGYSTLTQEVAVGDTDLDLGDVIVNELAFPPFDVVATLSDDNMEAYVEWVSPDEYDFVDFRYDDGVPVMAIGLPDGTNNSILGAVHRRSAILNSVSWYTGGTTPHAAVNVFIFGLNAQGNPNSNVVLYQAENVPNNHQQWTIHELPEEIDAPNGFLIGLSVTGNLGIAADNGVGDPYHFQNNTHYYTSNYTTGTWATMESAGYMNNFLIRAQGFDLGPIRSSGELFSEGRPELMTTGFESVELLGLTGNSPNPASKRTMTTNRNNRVLIGFIVFRLEVGQEQTPDLWTEIGTVTETEFIDTGVSELLNGSYRYAVRSVYTNNVLSVASLSNVIEYEEEIPYITNLQAEVDANEGNVYLSWQFVGRGQRGSSVRTSRAISEEDISRSEERAFLGFKITRNGPVIDEGIMETNYLDEGLQPGEYNYTVIGEYTNGSTNMLSVTAIVPTSINDEDTLLEPLVTSLSGNFPNPFNPDTTINYSIDADNTVIIEIFNVRGQLVRTLVNEHQTAGRYSVVWNGKDEEGRNSGSGIYFFRMKAGRYTSTRKMIMMK